MSVPVHAHQMRAALSTVLFNERTDRIEVMHRFFSHDAEHLLSVLLGPGADINDSADDRNRFGIYVHDNFRLFTPAGDAIPLTLKGVEVDGDFLWVYQAAPIPQPPLSGLQIENFALRDVWPDQVNTVNVERDGRVQTVIFTPERQRLMLKFQ